MNNESTDVYRDVPLLADKLQIRLLELQPCPRHVESDVRCTLTLASLDDAPEFEALSYAWGDQKNLKSISLSGATFSVTANLASALKHLRRDKLPRMLWVDAICINQSDIAERSSQVAMMHDIYQRALRTVSWLGEGGEDGELALRFLHWHAKRQANALSSNTNGQAEEFDTVEGWAAAARLMQRPYWRRLWVMQEISFSQIQPRIACGTQRIPWSTLIAALGDSESASYIKRLNRVRGATRELIRQGSKDRPSRNGRHVIFLLSHSSGFETTEPRDRVYALYGLMKVAGIVDFKPDYSKSIAEVYRQITEYVLRMKNSLNILEMRSHEQVDDMPSWVIDFSKPSTESFPSTATTMWQRTNDKKQLAIPDMSIDSEASTLEVTGSTIDHIALVNSIPTCVATALRRAAEDPLMESQSGESLRSSNRAALLYWKALSDPQHTTALCHNLFEFMTRHRELVSLLCGSMENETPLPEWYPRPWEMHVGAVDCTTPSTSGDTGDELDPSYRQALQRVLCTLSMRLYGRVCFQTREGSMGTAVAGVQIGDEIVAFQSTKQLHVLRRREDGFHRYAGAAVLVAPKGKEGVLSAALRRVRDTDFDDQRFCIQ